MIIPAGHQPIKSSPVCMYDSRLGLSVAINRSSFRQHHSLAFVCWACVQNVCTVLVTSLVTIIFLYACKSWTLTAELHRRIRAMEMRCYRKILRISYKDYVTNGEVGVKIQQAIGPHEDPPDHRKEIQIEVVWTCLLFIRFGQNHLAGNS